MKGECKKLRKKASAYLDQEISGVEKDKIDKHLTVCPDCLTFFNSLKNVWESVERGLASTPQFNAIEARRKFWSSIDQKETSKAFLPSPLRFSRAFLTILILFIALPIGFLLGSIFSSTIIEKSESTTGEVISTETLQDPADFYSFIKNPSSDYLEGMTISLGDLNNSNGTNSNNSSERRILQ